MKINNTSIATDGGAVSNKAVGTAFIAVGAVTSGAWSLGSHVHTAMSAPVLTLGTLGAATAMAGGGYAIGFRKTDPASTQTVDATATAVA